MENLLKHIRKQACKGCGKRVLFVRDGAGTPQILDAIAPVYALFAEGLNNPYCVREREAFVSHFATCPAAHEFGKKKKGG
jgi:hypothetical protein